VDVNELRYSVLITYNIHSAIHDIILGCGCRGLFSNLDSAILSNLTIFLFVVELSPRRWYEATHSDLRNGLLVRNKMCGEH